MNLVFRLHIHQKMSDPDISVSLLRAAMCSPLNFGLPCFSAVLVINLLLIKPPNENQTAIAELI